MHGEFSKKASPGTTSSRTTTKSKFQRKEPNRKIAFPGEKILGLIFSAVVCFGSVHIISNQASIYDTE